MTVIAEAADDTLLAATEGSLRPDQQVYYIGTFKGITPGDRGLVLKKRAQTALERHIGGTPGRRFQPIFEISNAHTMLHLRLFDSYRHRRWQALSIVRPIVFAE